MLSTTFIRASFAALLIPFLPITQAAPLSCNAPRSEVTDIATAVNKWRADTGTVSQFLSTATGLSGSRLVSAAKIALAAENDELTHKAVIDKYLGQDTTIKGADHTLVGDQTFQSVVDALQDFVDNGAKKTPEQVDRLVKNTNKVRCGAVLPAIDTYFRVSANFLNTGLAAVAARPNNCPAQ
ncbi:hypothetical protein F5Y18DRAFT_174752 [Xylariaceae sp. FL1019]|nr:hypothetical protein F5Y18DRAFT_174752 [Xylariaceae sp. FL1019]